MNFTYIRIAIALSLATYGLTALGVQGEYVERHIPNAICKIQIDLDPKISGGPTEGTCTGSLFLSQDMVASAAHCFLGAEVYRNRPIAIDCAAYSSTAVTMHRTVNFESVKVFKGAGDLLGLNDLAIIYLSEPAPKEFVPFQIPSSPQATDEIVNTSKECLIGGFGYDNENKMGKLHIVAVKPKVETFESEFGWRQVLEIMNIRSGDSGGPTFCGSQDGGYTQVGLTSQLGKSLGLASLIK